MPPTIQLKRGTAATLLSVNPFPLVGEIIFEQNTGLFKIGDGIRSWVDLPYANPQTTLSVNISNIIGLQEALNNKSDITHFHSISNVTGLQAALEAKAPIASPTFTGTVSGITKGMVGLGNVDNTSDADKPVSAAQAAADSSVQNSAASDATTKANAAQAFAIQRANHTGTQAISTVDGLQTALDGKAATTHSHAISDVTGLQTVLDGKQASGTYATLVGGTVPASQLPSYVDDVLEYSNLAAFPATGETSKIYVALDTNKTYRWGGSAYVPISASPGSTDDVPEGSVNKYYTAARASADAPVQSVAGRTGIVTLTKTDVGLSNVDNTADANKPVSTAQASADTAVQNAAATDATTKANAAQDFAIQRANHTGTQDVSTVKATGFAENWGYLQVNAAGDVYPETLISATQVRVNYIDRDDTFQERNDLPQNGPISVSDAIWFLDERKSLVGHQHSIADTTGLQTALDSKLPTADINTDLLAGAGIGFIYSSAVNALTIYSTNENYVTALGAVSGSVGLNYDPTNRAIQTMTLGGTATTLFKNLGWPTSASISVDVVLKITVTTATTVTWSIVNEWYSQPAAGALSVGTHLFLLRAIGSTIEGHYIGSRTN